MEGLRPESESRSVVSDSLRPRGLHSPWNSPGKNTGVGSLSLLQGIFPTQGLNPGLPHCRRILHQLSHQGRLSHLPVLPLPQAFYSFLELPSRMPDSSISLIISFMFSFPLSLSAVLLILFSYLLSHSLVLPESCLICCFSSVNSVAQLCPTFCDPMNRSTQGLPVHHQLLEFIQTHVHQVSDTIQPSHPLSSPSPPAPNPS